ncbi:hypothetical protein BT96DRAFT_976798 [Gymnopus androsaceus JB14]|uniref:Uncharacterized protein n=1 Tax=Gymnopus androsaceus JB14 TaxID=1447944 RepID=A0A6A4HK05_9AGAR|nr:hypothetical protein BT96DRAFT_976798 [Gymnopus androsaceus JB14]
MSQIQVTHQPPQIKRPVEIGCSVTLARSWGRDRVLYAEPVELDWARGDSAAATSLFSLIVFLKRDRMPFTQEKSCVGCVGTILVTGDEIGEGGPAEETFAFGWEGGEELIDLGTEEAAGGGEEEGSESFRFCWFWQKIQDQIIVHPKRQSKILIKLEHIPGMRPKGKAGASIGIGDEREKKLRRFF